MKSNEKHIRKTPTEAYCGEKISQFDFSLVDKEHAISCVEKGTLVQPCPKCWKAIKGDFSININKLLRGE